MKTTIKLLGAMAAMMALSACAGGSGGADVHTAPTQSTHVDSSGTCSPDYISKYNDIVHEHRYLKSLLTIGGASNVKIIGQVQALHNACVRFFQNHDNVSCKAEIDGKEIATDSSSAKAVCNEAKELLKKL